jgi:hypothetical protein
VAEGARLESVYTGNRIVGSNPTPSATSSASNILRVFMGWQKGAKTRAFVRKPPDCSVPDETRNSLSVAVILQTSRLRRFSTEFVSG